MATSGQSRGNKGIQNTQDPEAANFLGFANYYRRLVRNFSEIMTPFTNMTKGKPRQLRWLDQAVKTLEEVKSSLCKEPVLYMPKFQEPFFLQTDASGCAMGTVLFQKVQKEESPIAYTSKKLVFLTGFEVWR